MNRVPLYASADVQNAVPKKKISSEILHIHPGDRNTKNLSNEMIGQIAASPPLADISLPW